MGPPKIQEGPPLEVLDSLGVQTPRHGLAVYFSARPDVGPLTDGAVVLVVGPEKGAGSFRILLRPQNAARRKERMGLQRQKRNANTIRKDRGCNTEMP